MEINQKIEKAFKDLLTSLQTAKLYGPEHPITKDSIEKVYLSLQDVLAEREELVIGIIGEELAFEKEIFFLGLTAISSLHILFVATLMGSRYLLFPIVGIIGFLALFITRLIDKLSSARKYATYVIFWIMIIICAFLSYKITFYWKDDGSLARLMLIRYPDDSDVHENFGCWYSNSNNLTSAIKEYNRALELNPHLPRSRFNLAHAYYMLGRSDDAIVEFTRTAKEDKLLPHIHQALAVIYDQKGDRKKAIEEVKYELILESSDRLKMLEFIILSCAMPAAITP